MRFFAPILLVLFFVLSAFAQEQRGYNEIYDESGKIRPQYEAVLKIISKYSPKEIASIKKKLRRKDLMDDNDLGVTPRVLVKPEFDEMQAGAVQRAKALKAFLIDHYSGKQKYIKDGIIPKDVIERIMARYGEEDLQGVMTPEAIAFWYGPDIIRDKQGKWRMIEDNPAYVGLMGDLLVAKESLETRIPEYKKIKNLANPERFYKNMIESYVKEAGGKKVVLLQYLEKSYADQESTRIKQIFAEHGIETAHIRHFYKQDSNKFPYLKVEDGKLWYEVPGMPEKKAEVGFVISEIEPSDLDINHPAMEKKKVLEGIQFYLEFFNRPRGQASKTFTKTDIAKFKELVKPDPKTGMIDYQKILDFKFRGKGGTEAETFRELIRPEGDKSGVPGLLDLLVKGKVKASSVPGLEFIGDKEFYMFVEDLIRYYLKEEPILRNIKTRRLTPEIFAEVRKDFTKLVIKPVDGRGGDGIVIGPKETEATIDEKLKPAFERYRNYIVQEFLPLSEYDDSIVDTRYLMTVGHTDLIYDLVYACRKVLMSGDGKVNISKDGAELTGWILDLLDMYERSCPDYLKHAH